VHICRPFCIEWIFGTLACHSVAAETGRCDGAMVQSWVHLQVEPPRCEAARAVDMQLKAVAGDVVNGLERAPSLDPQP
jgi:hypothetical protein